MENKTLTETIRLHDTIEFLDNGKPRIGYVCTLPSHEWAWGHFHVSVACFQGLVAVAPKDVTGVRKNNS